MGCVDSEHKRVFEECEPGALKCVAERNNQLKQIVRFNTNRENVFAIKLKIRPINK